MNYSEIKIGDFYEEEFEATDEKVMTFAKISGDDNPIHVDEEFAKKTRFGKRIAHGILVTSFISKAIGRNFPGDGSIYVSQNILFKRPVYVGDKVLVRVEVTDKNDEKNRIILSTTVFNSDKKTVIEGTAEVLKE